MMRVETFEMRLPKPADVAGADWEALLGRPLRWAIVAVEEDTLVVVGARLCS
ncbi:MAG: hypothetical protein JWM80_4029 [Cyanobacteria bacterium RYN_339]|nr:hypothetical protein [Cyanobacteria bacterium RYN_339]